MTERRMEDKFSGIAKSLKEITKTNDKFNISLSKFVLSLPIPMKYETWQYLHSICDGDSDD